MWRASVWEAPDQNFSLAQCGILFSYFSGLILYVIVALIVQKKVRIDVPFCDAHRSWRTRMNIAGAVLLIGFIPTSFLLGSLGLDGGVVALIAIAMALSGLIVLAIVGSSFNSVYIDETCANFKGAGEAFLSSLPSAQASAQQSLAS